MVAVPHAAVQPRLPAGHHHHQPQEDLPGHHIYIYISTYLRLYLCMYLRIYSLQVAYIILIAGVSPRPASWVLERSLDGVTWQPWQVIIYTIYTQC